MSEEPSASASSSAAKDAASWSEVAVNSSSNWSTIRSVEVLSGGRPQRSAKAVLPASAIETLSRRLRDIGERAPELLRGDLDALPQALGRVGAGPHRHHLPDFFARLLARGVDQRAAAEGGREARLRQRRFARAAVGDDGDQAMLAEFFGEFGDLRLAAEEAVRLPPRASPLGRRRARR